MQPNCAKVDEIITTNTTSIYDKNKKSKKHQNQQNHVEAAKKSQKQLNQLLFKDRAHLKIMVEANQKLLQHYP